MARLGRLTSSTADAMLSRPRDKSAKESAGRRNLRVRLALERVVGRPVESDYQSQSMREGSEREADALAYYEALTGVLLDKTGFLSHTSLLAGASLDGHLDDFTGIVEVKSPLPATHWEYIRSNTVPLDYTRQIQHQMWITGADWCDFVSFNPDFPDTLRLKVVRFLRDEPALVEYERQVVAFLAEVDRDVDAIKSMADVRGQAETGSQGTQRRTGDQCRVILMRLEPCG
jgi:hypothetical protein